MADRPEKCAFVPCSVKFPPSLHEMTSIAAKHEGLEFGVYVKLCVMRDLEAKAAVAESHKPFLQVAALKSKLVGTTN